MALIEGFCDLVMQIFFISPIFMFIVVLWMYTEVGDMQMLRVEIFILEQRDRWRQRNQINRTSNLVSPQQAGEPTTNDTVSSDSNILVNATNESGSSENKKETATADECDATTNDFSSEPTNSSQNSCVDNSAISEPCQDSIRIRLKYLNDNCRLVEGRSNENIGVFKGRHFNSELSSNKRVRLIFLGKVLNDDQASLISCGLHDNCVVHCLIQEPSPNAQQSPDLDDQLTFGGWIWNVLLWALHTLYTLVFWQFKAPILLCSFFTFIYTGNLGFYNGIYLLVAFLRYVYVVRNEVFFYD